MTEQHKAAAAEIVELVGALYCGRDFMGRLITGKANPDAIAAILARHFPQRDKSKCRQCGTLK
jgi:hypothetical protein